PPRAREFEQPDPDGGEVPLQQRLARGRVELREAQLQVARGHAAAGREGDAQQRAHGAAQRALQRPRQPGQQRHGADAEPGRPVPRSERRCVAICHARILREGGACTRRRGGFAILCRMEAAPRDRAVERLLRGLYSAALYLLVPVTVYHLIWRGFRQAEYLERWGERYAAYRSPPLGDGCIWVHAVSVGEVGAAAPLVNALLELRPDQRLLVTTITPTGSARVRALWG